MLHEFPDTTQHQYAILLSLKCVFRLLLEVMLETVEVVDSNTTVLERRRLSILEKQTAEKTGSFWLLEFVPGGTISAGGGSVLRIAFPWNIWSLLATGKQGIFGKWLFSGNTGTPSSANSGKLEVNTLLSLFPPSQLFSGKMWICILTLKVG